MPFHFCNVKYLKQYLGERKDDDPWLFAGRNGKRIGVSAIEYIIKHIGMRANVSDCHPHRFRRTLATEVLNRGMDIMSVSQILGHESISTTQTYLGVKQEMVRANYERFAL